LTYAVGEPELLFRASQSGWAEPIEAKDKKAYVTDGPFIYTTKNGQLLLLWSSFINNSYTIGIASPKNNKIDGEYEHIGSLYAEDGGHGMVFTDLNDDLFLSIHKPNNTPNERALFLPLKDTGDTLELL